MPRKKTSIAGLTGLRKRIDQVDQKLLNLLNDRARLAIAVGKLKEKHGRRVFDRKREQEVLQRLVSINGGPLNSESIRKIFRQVVRHTRRLEESLGSGTRPQRSRTGD